MSTVFSPSPSSVGLGRPERDAGVYRASSRFDGSRSLAAMLLAAVVAALVVLADQMVSTWADGHLFLGWVTLWVVIFAGTALFAGTARRAAHSVLRAMDGWSRSLAEARAETRLWDLARTDPRLKAELMLARERAANVDEELTASADASNDFSAALSPMGLESGIASPALLRRWAQMEMRRQHGYLPYL